MKSMLSPKALAQAIGVSESSLKRWADDGRITVARTAGGHRRIPVAEALRFVRETGLSLAHPEVMGLPELGDARAELGVTDNPLRRGQELLFDALNGGDEAKARGVVLDLYLSGHSVAGIFDGPIRNSMAQLGELWLHSDAGIYIEHRATDICLHILALLRSMAVPPGERRQDQPVALGGAPSGDPYVMPSLMATIVLAETGYRDVNLGPETPMNALLAAVGHYRPRLVWLSCSVGQAMPPHRELAQLLDLLGGAGGVLAMGGRSLADVGPLPRRDNLQVVTTMAELAAFARGLLGAKS